MLLGMMRFSLRTRGRGCVGLGLARAFQVDEWRAVNKSQSRRVKGHALAIWRQTRALRRCFGFSQASSRGRQRAAFALSLFAAVLIAGPAATALAAGAPKVRGELKLAWQSTRGEPQARIEVRLKIDDGWHINSHQPRESYLVPTEVVFTIPAGLMVKDLHYPQPVIRKLSFAGGEGLRLYEGDVSIWAQLEGKAESESPIRVMVKYQACSDTVCLRPASLSLELSIDEGKPGQGASAGRSPPQQPGGMVEGWIASGGYFYALAAVFVLGLALNLTPCVYPLISITVAYFGGQTQRNSRQWLLAAAYVLGICVTFSVMGVFAALSGGFFGAALQNSGVLLGVSALMLVLAASNFGFYQFRVPARIAGQAGKAARGIPGAVFMGLTMGLVAAPCIGPVVIGLLVFVGARQDPWLGLLFFSIMALGLGLPYLFLAVATGSLQRLPRSGQWLEWVERFFGFVLVGMAIYFAAPVLGESFTAVAVPLLIACAGVYLGFIFGRFAGVAQLARRSFGIGACAFALWLAVPEQEISTVRWQEFAPELVVSARSERKPAIVEFTAQWCLPCREMDRSTFTNVEIGREAERFLMLRADVTASTAEKQGWMSMFSVSGVPTIIFLRPDGSEETRAIGYVGHEKFLELMRRTG